MAAEGWEPSTNFLIAFFVAWMLGFGFVCHRLWAGYKKRKGIKDNGSE
ncbi:hypothetical protein DSC45_34230 [Streptomyces sp. YIM 130001]|nr:hypothetical protein DSC45_34230 [Streptomyces sp. YIM 130001]